jgi:hypothetical protein
MSFQDVGRNNSRRQPANATFQSNAPTRPGGASGAGWGVGTTGGSSSSSSITQISEALLQYQVGRRWKCCQQSCIRWTVFWMGIDFFQTCGVCQAGFSLNR